MDSPKKVKLRKRVRSSDNVVVTRKKPLAKPKSKSEKPPPPKPKPKPAPQKRLNIPREFVARVRRDVEPLLPPWPYQLRIDGTLFHLLKDKYPGERTKLRNSIKIIIAKTCRSYGYIEHLRTAKCRHGIDGKEYPLDPAHTKTCKRRLHEIREARAKHLKKVKAIIKHKKQRKRSAA